MRQGSYPSSPEALQAKEAPQNRVILFNLSGHGHLDMGTYDSYFPGKLEDNSYPRENVQEALKHLPHVG